MRAFIEERLAGNCEAALDLLTSALEVLRWGQTIWKDVSDEDKGAIFRPMFVRGVKCLRLNAFMSVRSQSCNPCTSDLTRLPLLAGLHQESWTTFAVLVGRIARWSTGPP